MTNWSFLSAAPFPKNTFYSKRLSLRIARDSDMENIYMLGYSEWGEGMALDEYLDLCKNSIKYQKGTWVLFEDLKNKSPIVALICYQLAGVIDVPVVGIGSLATHPSLRKQGYASEALKTIMDIYDKNFGVQFLILFPDNETTIYETLGFICANPSASAHLNDYPMYYSTGQATLKHVANVSERISCTPYF
ncbi:GNAT family N-acetyltransferase [Limnohabitans sp.]|uniref:GNAT family N-acetyltransferase n=1 Tax=Limnohabitans sp. TaxID=1907725 RepID=UPI0037BF3BAC